MFPVFFSATSDNRVISNCAHPDYGLGINLKRFRTIINSASAGRCLVLKTNDADPPVGSMWHVACFSPSDPSERLMCLSDDCF